MLDLFPDVGPGSGVPTRHLRKKKGGRGVLPLLAARREQVCALLPTGRLGALSDVEGRSREGATSDLRGSAVLPRRGSQGQWKSLRG